MNEEMIKAEKELANQIDDWKGRKKAGLLSPTGEAYLEGLEEAYNKIFPIRIQD